MYTKIVVLAVGLLGISSLTAFGAKENYSARDRFGADDICQYFGYGKSSEIRAENQTKYYTCNHTKDFPAALQPTIACTSEGCLLVKINEP